MVKICGKMTSSPPVERRGFQQAVSAVFSYLLHLRPWKGGVFAGAKIKSAQNGVNLELKDVLLVYSSSNLIELVFFSPRSFKYFSVVESLLWPASLETMVRGVPAAK